MATYKTVGIVLGRHNLGEADRIITFLTPDRGKIRAVAKGVRRIKSRLAGHLELFCQSELMLAEGRNLDIVTSARLQQYHESLVGDYDRMRAAYLVAEIAERLITEDGEAQPAVYQLVVEALAELASRGADPLLELSFKLRLADELGYRPQLEACVNCGRHEASEKYFLNPARGGILDGACYEAGSGAMSQRQIKLWRMLLASMQPAQLVGESALAGEGIDLCNQFYDYVFGRTFRSSQMLAT